MSIFTKVTYINIDGIWFYESELNFLLLEVFCEFSDITGDPMYRQGQVGVTGVTEGSRLGSEQEVVSSPSPRVAFLDPVRSIPLSCELVLQPHCGSVLWCLWKVFVQQWKARKEYLELKYLIFLFP